MCFAFTYAVDGWRTEPNVFYSSASVVTSSRKDILTDRKRDTEQERAIDFTVLEDAYSAAVSGKRTK